MCIHKYIYMYRHANRYVICVYTHTKMCFMLRSVAVAKQPLSDLGCSTPHDFGDADGFEEGWAVYENSAPVCLGC